MCSLVRQVLRRCACPLGFGRPRRPEGPILSRTTAEAARILRLGGLLFLVENTSSNPASEHWVFKSVADYRAMFPSVDLEHLHDYVDLGERISVLAGRRR